LIVRNCARFAIIGGIGTILMFIGKALIMAMSGWIAYLIIMNSDKLKDKVSSPIFPIIVVVVIAYLVSSIFLSVYSFASNAILHAFLLDEEVKGNHAPTSLKNFVARNDRTLQDNQKSSEQKPNDGKEKSKANNMS
jgi:choline transporter-like protein 2/4/5